MSKKGTKSASSPPVAHIRAADGSAFIPCDGCNKSVPAALINSHTCEKISESCKTSAVAVPAAAAASAVQNEKKRKTPSKSSKNDSSASASKEKKERKSKKSEEDDGEGAAAAADRPKRPLTSYLRFCGDKRASIKELHPELSQKELLTKLSELWKSLSEEEKKPYEDAYKADKAQFEQTYGDSAYKRQPKKDKKEKKEKKEGKPKKDQKPRPLSGYMLFSKENRALVKEKNPEAKLTDVTKILAAMWGELSANEQQAWKDKGKELGPVGGSSSGDGHAAAAAEEEEEEGGDDHEEEEEEEEDKEEEADDNDE